MKYFIHVEYYAVIFFNKIYFIYVECHVVRFLQIKEKIYKIHHGGVFFKLVSDNLGMKITLSIV